MYNVSVQFHLHCLCIISIAAFSGSYIQCPTFGLPGQLLLCQVNIVGPETEPSVIAESDGGSSDEPCWLSLKNNFSSRNICTTDVGIILTGNQSMFTVTVLPQATGTIVFYLASGVLEPLPNATNATITIGH